LSGLETWFVPRVPSAFGEDAFGRRAEAAARFFGTPQYIAGQTVLVIAWIAVNAVAVSLRWDPYPFILLNLAFSTQAAYAAPLILLAQTRQADRDKAAGEQLEAHRDEVMRHMQQREAAIKKAEAAEDEARRRAGLPAREPAEAVRPVEVLRGALNATKANGQPDWAIRVSAARTLAALRPEEVYPDEEEEPGTRKQSSTTCPPAVARSSTAPGFGWDVYPFIALNLLFSLQAAYAAPLILLAQTRQADRDKRIEDRAEQHHEEQVRFAEQRVAAVKAETDKLAQLLESNTDLTREDKELTEQVAELTKEIHAMLARR